MTSRMFVQVLRTQWAWTRVPTLLLAVAAFVIPSLMWRLTGATFGAMAPYQLMQAFEMIGPTLACIAIIGAYALAALPWTFDAETRHVYPMSLPIPWKSFVAMRFASGAITLLVPTVGLLLGSLFILAQIDLPPVLHAYPVELSTRFFLALLMLYSASFALQYLAGRRATVIVLLMLLFSVPVVGLISAIGGAPVTAFLARWLFEWPGPFAILTEPWRLIDV